MLRDYSYFFFWSMLHTKLNATGNNTIGVTNPWLRILETAPSTEVSILGKHIALHHTCLTCTLTGQKWLDRCRYSDIFQAPSVNFTTKCFKVFCTHAYAHRYEELQTWRSNEGHTVGWKQTSVFSQDQENLCNWSLPLWCHHGHSFPIHLQAALFLPCPNIGLAVAKA